MTEKKCMNECLRSLMPYPYACTKIYEKTQTFKHDQKLQNNMATKTILNQFLACGLGDYHLEVSKIFQSVAIIAMHSA